MLKSVGAVSIEKVTLQLAGQASWDVYLAIDFWRASPFSGLISMALDQANPIPDISWVIIEVQLSGSMTGRYGPIPVADRKLAARIFGDLCILTLSNDQFVSLLTTLPANLRLEFESAKECATWDATLREQDESLASHLNARMVTNIPTYLSFITLNVDGDKTSEIAEQARSEGFSCQKWALQDGPADGEEGLRRNIRRIRQLYEVLGINGRLFVEVRQRWNIDYTMAFIQALGSMSLSWLEQPVPDVNTEELLKEMDGLCPLATGETFTSIQDFFSIYDSKGLVALQPDLLQCGGIRAFSRVASLVYGQGLILAPHGKALMTSLHFMAARSHPDSCIAEFNPILEPQRQKIMGQHIVPNEGYIRFNSNEFLGLWQK